MLKKHSFWFLLGLLLIIRIIFAILTPLVADEAYYLLWASHLDWSYVDHPGMIAWLNKMYIFFLREPLLAIRFGSIDCLAVTCLVMYFTIPYLNQEPKPESRKPSKQAIILFLLIPYIFVISPTMQIEQPLLMFTAITIYFYLKLLKTKNTQNLYFLAIFSALGILTKYTFALVPLFMFISLFLPNNPINKIQNQKSETSNSTIQQFNNSPKPPPSSLISHLPLPFLLFLLLLTPILYWNLTHNFISFTFHLNRIGDGKLFEYTGSYILEQLVYLSPIIVFYITSSYKRYKNQELATKTMFWLGTTIFLTFLIISIKTKIWPHWLVIMYIPFTLYLAKAYENNLFKITYKTAIFSGLIAILLLFTGPAVFTNFSKLQDNYKLRAQITNLKKRYPNLQIISDNHGSVSQLSYYGNSQVNFPSETFKPEDTWGSEQFALWKKPSIQLGNSVLFFATPTPKKLNNLRTKFDTITVLNDMNLHVLEGYIAKKKFILCKNAKTSFLF